MTKMYLCTKNPFTWCIELPDMVLDDLCEIPDVKNLRIITLL